MSRLQGDILTLGSGTDVWTTRGQLSPDPWYPDTVRNAENTCTTSGLSPNDRAEIAEHMIEQWRRWAETGEVIDTLSRNG